MSTSSTKNSSKSIKSIYYFISVVSCSRDLFCCFELFLAFRMGPRGRVPRSVFSFGIGLARRISVQCIRGSSKVRCLGTGKAEVFIRIVRFFRKLLKGIAADKNCYLLPDLIKLIQFGAIAYHNQQNEKLNKKIDQR